MSLFNKERIILVFKLRLHLYLAPNEVILHTFQQIQNKAVHSVVLHSLTAAVAMLTFRWSSAEHHCWESHLVPR